MAWPIFGDAETEALFGSAALAAAMLTVEAALAEAQGDAGVIPAEAGAAIGRAALTLQPDVAALAESVAGSGVPVPQLVAALKDAVGDPYRDWVHWGATSQDIVDTAFALQYGRSLDLLSDRLSGLVDLLEAQSWAHAATAMAARTRGQIATPIAFGLRVAQWAQPLISLENEIGATRSGVCKLQLGGAAGARSVMAPNGGAVTAMMAKALGLIAAPPWHADRSGMRRFSQWLSRLVAATAKIGGDLAISARTEIGEASAGQSGVSSTMPHKSNPVSAEALQSLLMVSLACEAGLAAAATHREERDGAAWSVEWLLLPRHCVTAASALRKAEHVISGLRVDTAQMRRTLERNPATMAERASFTLSEALGREVALAQVKAALAADGSFRDALEANSDRLDLMDRAFDFDAEIGASTAIISEIFGCRSKNR